MKVIVSRGFGNIGPKEFVEIPDDMIAYKQEYDGAGYVIYSKTEIFDEDGTEICGRVNPKEENDGK